MKYLKKFENNNNGELDIEYIKECFIDFMNEYNEIVEGTLDGRKYAQAFIMLPHIKRINNKYVQTHLSEYYEIGDKVKEMEENVSFYKDMEVCIEKVKIEFPEIEVSISNLKSTYSTSNRESYETFIRIEFYFPKPQVTKDLEKNKLNI